MAAEFSKSSPELAWESGQKPWKRWAKILTEKSRIATIFDFVGRGQGWKIHGSSTKSKSMVNHGVSKRLSPKADFDGFRGE